MTAVLELDNLLDPLSRCLDEDSARRLLSFRVNRSVQQRIETLGEKANEGRLSSDERLEYEALINASDLIAILKLRPGAI